VPIAACAIVPDSGAYESESPPSSLLHFDEAPICIASTVVKAYRSSYATANGFNDPFAASGVWVWGEQGTFQIHTS